MEEALKKIRDLTIITAIYLYFIAWVYVHFYYQQFGISTESIKIDYNSYLVYSYNVLISSNFLFWLKLIIAFIVLRLVVIVTVRAIARKNDTAKKMSAYLSGHIITKYAKKLNQQYSLLLLIIALVIIFPLMFKVARQVAIDNYRQDRLHTENLKTVQFIFRKDADLMSPAIVLDSTLPKTHLFFNDIAVIKNDPQQLLKLLGESDKYYIVLQQRPFNKILGALPSGYVYFIDKQDILLSKIILRSF